MIDILLVLFVCIYYLFIFKNYLTFIPAQLPVELVAHIRRSRAIFKIKNCRENMERFKLCAIQILMHPFSVYDLALLIARQSVTVHPFLLSTRRALNEYLLHLK